MASYTQFHQPTFIMLTTVATTKCICSLIGTNFEDPIQAPSSLALPSTMADSQVSECSSAGNSSSSSGSGPNMDPMAFAAFATQQRDEYLYKYAQGMTVFDRFTDVPAPGGLRMLNRLEQCYEVPQEKLEQVKNGKVPWFHTETGQPNFVCHELNCREHDVVLDEYVESILEHGIVQKARGSLYATLSLIPVVGSPGQVREGFPLRLLSWGTLGRAFYSVVVQAPAHPNIVASLERGISNLTVFGANFPRDCCQFIRDSQNNFHGGASDSFIKLLRDTQEVEANWLAHCSLSNPTYTALASFLDAKYKDKYGSVNQFELCKTAMHKLERMGVFQEFCTFFGQIVRFRDRSLATHDAIVNLHQLTVVLEKLDASLKQPATHCAILYEGYKMMVPLSKMKKDKLIGKRIPPQIFEKSGQSRIRWLLTDMTDSKVYSAPRVSKATKIKPEVVIKVEPVDDDDEGLLDDKENEEPHQKKRRTKAKVRGPPQFQETLNRTILENGKARSKLWVEDLVLCLDVAYKHLPWLTEDQLMKSKTLLIGLGLEFCWSGKVSLDGEVHIVWSGLRKKLQAKVFALHPAPLSNQDSDDDELGSGSGGGAPVDIADALLKSLETVVGDVTSGVVRPPLQPKAKATFQAHESALLEFLEKNPLKKPAMLHQAYKSAQDHLLTILAEKSVMTGSIVVECIRSGLEIGGFKPQWAELFLSIGHHISQHGELPEETIKVFGDVSALEDFMALRCKHMALLLLDVERCFPQATPFAGSLEKVFAKGQVEQDLVFIDLAPNNGKVWVEAWTALLVRVKVGVANAMHCPDSQKFLQTSIASVMNEMNLIPSEKPMQALNSSPVKLRINKAGQQPGMQAGASPTDELQLQLLLAQQDLGIDDESHIGFSCLYQFLGGMEDLDDETYDYKAAMLPDTIPALVVPTDRLTVPLLKQLCKWIEFKLYEKEFLGGAWQCQNLLALDVTELRPKVLLRAGCTLPHNTSLVYIGTVGLLRTQA